MREIWFESGGVRLFAVEDGQGPVIVMLHGGMAIVLVQPVYGGGALDEGVEVLRPLYANLPEPIREQALKMIEGFDAASVVATSRFIASGAQPFTTAADLRSLSVPTLLVRGNDPLHPAGISDLYAENIPGCTVASTTDVTEEIGVFCDRVSK